MDAHVSVELAPAWRGKWRRVDQAQGLVIVSQDAGALTRDDTMGRLCRVLQGYALSTLSIARPAYDPGRTSQDAVLWREGFDAALHWLETDETVDGAAIGLLGEDDAALAALRAAAGGDDRIMALVACGGRIEQVSPVLGRVRAATLLLVGSLAADELAGHRQALLRLHGPRRLEAIPGARVGFTEPGTFDTAAHLAGSWLRDHLGRVH